MSTNRFRDLQYEVAFSTPNGLPPDCNAIRTVPTRGSNMSYIFGEDCLAALDVTEEQLELLEPLRFLPETLLSKYVGSCASTDILSSVQRDLLHKTNALVRRTKQCDQQCNRLLSSEQFQRLIQISIAERRAGQNLIYFTSHCRSLRNRYTTLSRENLAAIEVLLNQIEGYALRAAEHPPCADVAQMFYANCATVKSVQNLLHIFQPIAQQIKTFSQDDLERMVSNSEALRNSYTNNLPTHQVHVTRKQLLYSQISSSHEAEHSWATLARDTDILRFLFGITTNRDIDSVAMTELIYVYTTEHTVRSLTATPAELALHALISNRIDAMTSALLLCSLMSSFMWRFAECQDSLRTVYNVSQSFRTLSRVGELLGVTVSKPFKRLAQHLEQILPYLTTYTAGQHCDVDEILKSSDETVRSCAELRCWSFSDTQKPWLPERIHGALNVHGPLDIIRSDEILSDFRASDFWLHLKWAGVNVDAHTEEELSRLRNSIDCIDSGVGDTLNSELGNDILVSLLNYATGEPTKNANLLMSLLAITSEEKPLFFNKDAPEAVDILVESVCWDDAAKVVDVLTESVHLDESEGSDEWPTLL